MQTQVQAPEYVEAPSRTDETTINSSDAGTLSTVANETQSENQVSEIGRKTAEFLERLPENIASFVNEYKFPVISFAVLVAAVIALRILLAITDAIDDIPFLASFFQLVGFSYVIWFVSRYFIKASTRQELAGEIESTKQQIADSNAS
ncbi:MAG: CAAD domain-containing protein [Aulosira sp. DedQUE10]|nr:CAAD domain-containing protein [Aulosira sp. DedQUE10]